MSNIKLLNLLSGETHSAPKVKSSGKAFEPPEDKTFPTERYNQEVLIPKGTFTMGTDDPQIPDDGESPPQVVTLTKDYYIDKERAVRLFILKFQKFFRGPLSSHPGFSKSKIFQQDSRNFPKIF